MCNCHSWSCRHLATCQVNRSFTVPLYIFFGWLLNTVRFFLNGVGWQQRQVWNTAEVVLVLTNMNIIVIKLGWLMGIKILFFLTVDIYIYIYICDLHDFPRNSAIGPFSSFPWMFLSYPGLVSEWISLRDFLLECMFGVSHCSERFSMNLSFFLSLGFLSYFLFSGSRLSILQRSK
jgi:hypothetical protein